jgi:membrane-associated phospholipid phosphatase
MHGLEMQWIEWVQEFRTPFLDGLFRFLRFFDQQEFMFVLIPIVWLNYGWKNGLRLFYILFLNALLNHVLKDAFASPRPCSLNRELALIPIGGYGFPSGAAQTVALLSAFFVYFQKNPLKWAIVIPYFLLVSFSRVYLGVHFLSDILGGWTAGFALFFGLIYFMPRVEKTLSKASIYKLLPLHLFVTLTLIFLSSMYHNSSYMGCSIGIAIGLFLCHKFKVALLLSRGSQEYILRSVIGVIGVFSTYMLFSLSSFLGAFFSSLWVSFFALLILRQKSFLR